VVQIAALRHDPTHLFGMVSEVRESFHCIASGIEFCNDRPSAVTIPVLKDSPGATIADQKPDGIFAGAASVSPRFHLR
jgi:hypothetical protein